MKSIDQKASVLGAAVVGQGILILGDKLGTFERKTLHAADHLAFVTSRDPEYDELHKRMLATCDRLLTLGAQVQRRVRTLEALTKARVVNGGAGLQKGSGGRNQFEKFVADPKLAARCHIRVELRLEVKDGTEELTPIHYVLVMPTEKQNEEIGEAMADPMVHALVRKAGGYGNGAPIPAHYARALQSRGVRLVPRAPAVARVEGKHRTFEVPIDQYRRDPEAIRKQADTLTDSKLPPQKA